MRATYLISAAVLVASGDAAARSACPRPDTRVESKLKTDLGQIKIVHRYNRKHLAKLQRQNRKIRGDRAWQPVGLTQTDLEFRMRVQVNAASAGANRYCGSLDRVEAFLGYDQLTVYIARKYGRRSCHYKSILAHENLHVAIFRDTLEDFAPRMEQRLRQTAEKMKPVLVRSAQQAADRLQAAMQRQMRPLFRQMNAALDRANAAIDTPENYKREQAHCKNW